MIGNRAHTNEDAETTELLVGNAQNLMQAVKETVKVAESVSIKIRTLAGMKISWKRRAPWHKE